MNSSTSSLEVPILNFREIKAISQHLQCQISELIDVQQWAYVIWVKFEKDGKIRARFVSYRVIWKFVPKSNGLYLMSDQVVRVQFASLWTFRIVQLESRKVLGWFELLPNGAIKRGFDANGDRLTLEQLRALEFTPYQDILQIA